MPRPAPACPAPPCPATAGLPRSSPPPPQSPSPQPAPAQPLLLPHLLLLGQLGAIALHSEPEGLREGGAFLF